MENGSLEMGHQLEGDKWTTITIPSLDNLNIEGVLDFSYGSYKHNHGWREMVEAGITDTACSAGSS